MRVNLGTNFLKNNPDFRQKKLDIQSRNSNFSKLQKNKPRKPFKMLLFYLLLLFIITAGVFAQQIFISKNTLPAFKKLTRLPVIREIRQVLGSNSNQLKGESRDRINVLILGQGGAGHPGPYLTDTIILASFKPSTSQIALLSIPRDMVVNIQDHGLERINAVNSYGETSSYPGSGAAMAARVLEKTLNLPINYYVRIDFSGFEKLIDDLGGVEININKTFTDYQYPDNEFGYQVVSFKAGEQTLSGDLALKYARSRHANNGEGGDFARAKRQQKLLISLKDKILTSKNFLNPTKLIKLYKNLKSNISTNVQIREIPLILSLAKTANFENITFKVLDDSPAGPLYATTLANGAYVLAPKISDYSEIQFIAKNLFTISDIKIENSRLVIQNGTIEEGLALNTAAILSAFEFKIIKISNAPSQNFQRTVLYDLTGNTKIKSKKFLEKTLQTKSQNTLPLTDQDFNNVDFLIILGTDQLPSAQASQADFLNAL